MATEFASLCDLALNRGIRHSDLLSEIQTSVLTAYTNKYKDKSQNTSVLIDELTGNVRIFKDNKDITPEEFSDQAASIARQVIIKHLWATENGSQTTYTGEVTKNQSGESIQSFFSAIIQTLFWGYNSFYLLFFILVFINDITAGWTKNLIESLKTFGYYKTFLLVLLLLVPLGSITYALKTKIYKESSKLIKLFFLLEFPLAITILIPFTIIPQTTPSMWFFSLMLFTIPIVLYFRDSLKKTAASWIKVLIVFLQQSALTTAVYFTTLFSFVAPVIIGGYTAWIIGSLFPRHYGYIPYGGYYDVYHPPTPDFSRIIVSLTLGVLGFIFIVGLTSLPYLITIRLFKIFQKGRLILIDAYDRSTALLFHCIFVTLWVLTALLLSYQPNASGYIHKLAQLSNLSTFDEKAAVINKIASQEHTIKQELMNMYHATNRFLFTRDTTALVYAYKDVFHLNEATANIVNNIFLTLAYPFVYQGETNQQAEAASAYINYFGHSISEDLYPKGTEYKAVSVSLRNINAKTDASNLLATITIEEEYTNTSSRSEEIIYEFSLPSDAVVTDLKLGPDLEYPGKIAPRGAASTTYQQEVNRSRDPALLEQVGPRQYRLRVFPVPAVQDNYTLKGKHQKVSFTYVTGLSEDGYALPVYSVKTNVNDENTKIVATLNEKTVSVAQKSEYLESGFQKSLQACTLRITDIEVPMGNNLVKLQPHSQVDFLKNSLPCSVSTGTKLVSVPSSSKLALIYDASYANRNDTSLSDLRQILQSNPDFLDRNSIDLYLFNDSLSSPRAITATTIKDPFEVNYFGRNDFSQALKNFNNGYDAVFIITSNSPVFKSATNISGIKTPLYFIHTDNLIPAYKTDLTAKIIQSGGKVEDTIKQALIDYTLTRTLKRTTTVKYLSVNPYWAVVSQPNDTAVTQASAFGSIIDNAYQWEQLTTSADNPFSYVAGHAYALYKLAQKNGELTTDLPFLDASNAFAVSSHIVTPYSSFIALVTDMQKANLENQTGKTNRYEDGLGQAPWGTSQINNQIRISEPAAGVRSFGIGGSIIGGLFGSADVMNFSVPSAGVSSYGASDGGSQIAISAPRRGITQSNVFVTLFTGANVILILGGLSYFLISKAKKVLNKKRS